MFIIFTFLLAILFPSSGLPDPDPAPVQTQTLFPSPPGDTIPAFPEQSDEVGCPLDLPDQLFHGIKSACGSKSHHLTDPKSYSAQLHRSRCCPVLAAWLYSAYGKTALSAKSKAPHRTAGSIYEMPVLPDDSETCIDTLEKAFVTRGISLGQPNDTCDVFYCYCDIRLHPFSCPEAFSVNSLGKLVGNGKVQKLERDCADGGQCSKCLNSLNRLNGGDTATNKTGDRKNKIHNRDCELMGLTWLLHKDRAAYIQTVSAVLRALMMNPNDPKICMFNTDGIPLAVDSTEINTQSSSSTRLYHYYFLCLLFILISFNFIAN